MTEQGTEGTEAGESDGSGDAGEPFRFYVSLPDGESPADGVFADPNDVHVNATGSVGVLPGDYYMMITYEVCPPTFFQETFYPADLPGACRNFTVGTSGQIVAAPGCEPDAISIDTTAGNSGGLTIRVMPFDVSRYMCDGLFWILVMPEGVPFYEVGERHALTAVAQFPRQPYCGDGIVDTDLGETCDDGNRRGDDGCDVDCQLEVDPEPEPEPEPEPTPHTCGNGVCEPGEECDDGNPHDGDGCSSSCRRE